jgi:caffeoyl-CoA O-methyltransferase
MGDDYSRAGNTYGNESIFQYLDRVHAPQDAGLLQAFEAPKKHDIPTIMVSFTDAKLLYLLLKMVGAKKVVEVGTLAGYSAIAMAQALPADGHLWTIEFNPKNAEVSRQNVAAAGLSERVTVLVGAGVDVLPTLSEKGPFDAVFVDADKLNYDKYGRWAAENVRSGGLLLGDNAMLFGRLLEESPEGAAMRRFHEEARSAFETVCIQNQEGLLVGVKR